MAFLLINVHWWRAVVNFCLNVTEKAPYTLSAVAFTINDKRIMKRLDSKILALITSSTVPSSP